MKRNKSFDKDNNPIYLVATPIGNLKEFTPRAIEVISQADIVACEDTRNTAALLSKFSIKKQLVSLREHNEKEASLNLIEKVKQGKKVAYVSDAGYPGISDPGNILVQEAIKACIPVSTVCGSSAFINALVASGQPTNHFYFYGFISPKENEAKEELGKLKDFKDTLVFYESPHRIDKTLKTLFECFGNRDAVIARELTKLNEEYIRGTLEELTKIDPSSLIGEMVIIVSGNKKESEVSDEEIIARLKYLISKGLSKKDAAEIASDEFKINKNRVYKLTIN